MVTDGYQAELECRRCGRSYMVPAIAVKFTYWYCHQCRTFNVWR